MLIELIFHEKEELRAELYNVPATFTNSYEASSHYKTVCETDKFLLLDWL